MTRFTRNALAFGVGLCLAPYALATGPAVVLPVVKPVVVTTTVVTPAAVTTPAAAQATTAAATSTAAAESAPTAASAHGPGWVGWAAFAGTGIFLGSVIASHWIFCVEDDRKPPKERKCYRPLRDGMPK